MATESTPCNGSGRLRTPTASPLRYTAPPARMMQTPHRVVPAPQPSVPRPQTAVPGTRHVVPGARRRVPVTWRVVAVRQPPPQQQQQQPRRRTTAPVALVVLIALAASGIAPAAALELTVTVSDLRSCSGQLLFALYDDPDAYPNDGERAVSRQLAQPALRAGTIGARFTVPELIPGTYAVSVVHDEDGDRELDTGLFGIPVEGVASMPAGSGGVFGPPRFAQAAFALDGDTEITVPMFYFGRARAVDTGACGGA